MRYGFGGVVKPAVDKSMYWSKRWKDLRLEVFYRDAYICQICGQLCEGRGRTNPFSPECDHIIPHKGDEDLKWGIDNLQTLHKKCHSLKTTLEDGGMHSGAQTHPEWLPAPLCAVTLVCGPSGAGKTTWAKAQAGGHDEVIDLDDCFSIVCGTHGHEADRRHLKASLRIRNKMIANLASRQEGRAYLIVSAPTEAERQWWAGKLRADIHLIRPAPGEIGRRNISERRKALAMDWYEAERLGLWKRPVVRRLVGLDGYPVK